MRDPLHCQHDRPRFSCESCAKSEGRYVDPTAVLHRQFHESRRRVTELQEALRRVEAAPSDD